jgi:very-short-patch-repair endonuclease
MCEGTVASELYEGIARSWRRHERAREAGSPTVSVLLGDPKWLATAVEDALASSGGTIVWSNAATSDDIAHEWLQEIAKRRDLVAEAFQAVALALEESERELSAAWLARSTRERWMWLEHCEARARAPTGALEVLRATLEPSTPFDGASRLRGLMSWLPHSQILGLTVDDTNTAALHGVLAIAVDAPRLPLLACVEESLWGLVRAQLNDRSRTLLEQGLIPEMRRHRAEASDKPEAIASSKPPNFTHVDARQLAEALEHARIAAARQAPNATELQSRARSMAEQRLFDLLQADLITRGLFELNARMPFTFGPGQAEVDLVCSALRLAVEVDGYHHFQQSDAYRRDRRKDVLLQHHGYLVSRHLAEDVVERSGEVVRSIQELVKRRRRRRRRENAK